MKSRWIIPPNIPDLKPGELHIWKAHRSHYNRGHEATLAENERQRMQRFHFEKDRQLFTTSHHLLRRLIGACMNRSPRQIEFRHTSYGKPYLALDKTQRRWEFNLSHSGDLILIAIAHDVPIGVDVEHIHPLPELEQIALRFFSNAEQRQLASLSGDQKLLGFYQCWTRKESVIKACGEGLSMPLDSFQVSLLPGEPARLIHNPDSRSWLLMDLTLDPGYAGAVAAPVESLQVRFFSAENLLT